MPSITSQNGFSIIDILVSVLIMVVGLLGVAAMQMLNIKGVNNTQYRSIAVINLERSSGVIYLMRDRVIMPCHLVARFVMLRH